jgi:hypothetical protein
MTWGLTSGAVTATIVTLFVVLSIFTINVTHHPVHGNASFIFVAGICWRMCAILLKIND